MSELNLQSNSSTETTPVEQENTVKYIEIAPDCDIMEAQDSFIVTMDMPGITQSDLHVELDRDMLTVDGYSTIDGLTPRHYHRTFRVMHGIDAATVQAEYKNGVLALKLFKPSEQKPRQIAIQCG